MYHHIRIQQGDKMAEIVGPYRHVIESRIFALNIHPRHPMQNIVSNSLLNPCPFSFSHFSPYSTTSISSFSPLWNLDTLLYSITLTTHWKSKATYFHSSRRPVQNIFFLDRQPCWVACLLVCVSGSNLEGGTFQTFSQPWSEGAAFPDCLYKVYTCNNLPIHCATIYRQSWSAPAGSTRRKIRLIECNAKCRYLKKLTFKGTLWQVFIWLRPLPS
jgi:hypothetical protein